MLSLFQILSLIIYVAIASAAYLSYATAHRPFVSATLRRNRHSPDNIDLVVKNYGTFAAREIKLTFSSTPKSSIPDIDPEHQISNWHFIKEDINVLFPGEERSGIFDSSISRKSSSQPDGTDFPDEYRVEVSYKGRWRYRHKDSFVLDFREFYGVLYLT